MNGENINYLSSPKLSKHVFDTLGAFIHEKLGIKMPDSKRVMIESRLRKRLKFLGIDQYADYCDYLFSEAGMENEIHEFINVVTTNKTDFFREPNHFSYMSEKALPELAENFGSGINKTLNVWSSACSQGDEPYTLAIVLSEFAKKYKTYDFSILATDISMKILELAKKGVYHHSHIEPIDIDLRKKYLLKSKDKNKNIVRIIPELRKKIIFRQMNLIEGEFRIRNTMDIIFCRNVIIYFDRKTTDLLLKRLCGKLRTGGFLFMGHSELLDCTKLPLQQVAPTIYRKM